MSELINNSRQRKDLLKHMILQLHEGVAPEEVRSQLVRLMGTVPYGDVVEVEQELISEGLPPEEVLKLCDIHSEALKGTLDQSQAKVAPDGHPVHTFQQENRALEWEIKSMRNIFRELEGIAGDDDVSPRLPEIRTRFNALLDVEKHYVRKENLLFPFLEKYGVTGPPTVMWGKHDETRELLKAGNEVFEHTTELASEEAGALYSLVFEPLMKSIEEMIYKEDEILLPMALDKLSDQDWYDISRQSTEIGYCLYDPGTDWRPEGVRDEVSDQVAPDRILLRTGSFSVPELTAVLNTIPFDITFVDKDDKVRYFSEGKERIFTRNRAILGRAVQNCHPPKSVHIVEKILDDFHSGRQDQAAFWINMQGRFIHIEYYALRDGNGEYLGTLEVSQDLTEKRKLEGEQRLPSYTKQEGSQGTNS